MPSRSDAVDAAAAVVFGVNRSDLRILGAVADGPRTAGQVAASAHLSPAAATTAIQRLVAAATSPASRTPTTAGERSSR